MRRETNDEQFFKRLAAEIRRHSEWNDTRSETATGTHVRNHAST